jgi:AcrR family transcriptional regulator
VTSRSKVRKGRNSERRRTGRPSKTDESVGREALIDAARRLLKIRPPAQLSRNEIAKFAGVNPALIRYYFKDKSGLLTAVVEAISNENLARLRDILKHEGSAADKLRRRVQLMLQMHVENPHYHQLMFEQLWHGKGATERRLSREMVDPYFAEFRRIVETGQANGELRDVDLRYLHVAVIGLSELFINAPYVMRRLFKTRNITPRLINEYGNFVSDLLINGIGATRQRAPRPKALRSRSR